MKAQRKIIVLLFLLVSCNAKKDLNIDKSCIIRYKSYYDIHSTFVKEEWQMDTCNNVPVHEIYRYRADSTIERIDVITGYEFNSESSQWGCKVFEVSFNKDGTLQSISKVGIDTFSIRYGSKNLFLK